MNIDSHHLFETTGRLLDKVNMALTEVAYHLMPKTIREDVGILLKRLIQDLKTKKQIVNIKTSKEAPPQA